MLVRQNAIIMAIIYLTNPQLSAILSVERELERIRTMAKFSLDNPIFKEENSARQYLEATRWPDGPVCPHCGCCENIYELNGEAHRPGLYKCSACRKQFSVTVGTLFERSHVPLHKWVLTVHLLCASKKGHSAHQIHRMIGVTYKTAWFMCHRIREAMKDPKFKGIEGKRVYYTMS
jgi:transposase-like protein